VGVDRDASRVRYAARRYRYPNLSFRIADCERLDFPAESFDLVVSSNTLEHLTKPASFLLSVGTLLSRDGELVVAVPPVLSEADLREHGSKPDHVSNFSVRGWGDLFEREGWRFTYISHRCRLPLDFRSFRVSAAAADDFEFVEEGIDAAYESAPITAVFCLRRVR
jgi:SAM-dependent methyltransferase